MRRESERPLRGKTTQIYTQVSIRPLREIHTHPAQPPENLLANGTGQDAAELLATVGAEAEEDNEEE